MNASQTTLERVKRKLGNVSDYRAAQELGVTPQAVSKWKAGRNLMDDEAAIRAAFILGEPAGAVLALIASDRARSDHARDLWKKLARQLYRAAPAVLVAGALSHVARFVYYVNSREIERAANNRHCLAL